MKITTVILNKNGGKRESKINNNIDLDNLTLNSIRGVLKNKGSNISKLHTYLYDGKHLNLYGWDSGRAGQENKHDLPPPIDSNLYFNDIIIIATEGETIVEFTKQNYQAFYEYAFGGFESLGEEDTESSYLENTPRTDDTWKPGTDDISDDDTFDSLE